MSEMTSYQRFKAAYEHREADRIPIVDNPWGATVARWKREGMPSDADYVEYFGLDHLARIGVDNSPRYPVKVLAE
ncbi:MAG: hypothetical protein ACOCXX_02255, partial [Planctomycetota bacterium]